MPCRQTWLVLQERHSKVFRPSEAGTEPLVGGGSTKEAADFDPVIVGVKEVLTMAHSELCSFFAKPSLYVSVLRLALRPWVSLVHINH